jgi:protein O-GlcNAc transferase
MATIPESLGLAVRHHQAGQLSQAEQIYRQILDVNPSHPDALHLLGVIASRVGQYADAVDLIGRAIAVNPQAEAYHNNLGSALKSQGRIDEAIASYRRALQINPNFAETLSNLGIALKDQGKFDDAVGSYQRALQIKPDYAEAHYNLGIALKEQGKLDDAVASYKRAVQIKPDYTKAHSNLGSVLNEQAKFDEAVTSYQRALQITPNHADAHFNLGIALKEQGRPDEAVSCYSRALQIKPDYLEAYHNLLTTLSYGTDVTLGGLAQAHAEFDRLHAAPLRSGWKPHDNTRVADRPLRLGFLSPDLGRHPVGYFLIRILENLDSSECEIVCYSDRTTDDEMTSRFQTAATTWTSVPSWSDQRLAEKIREDKIDILFDLAGHTARNRLLVFARKAAPIQITWIGYFGTTGLTAMDHIMADRFVIPEAAESHYRENVVRMADGYLCYEPPSYASEVSALPAEREGYVTFGCFNNPSKITDQVVEAWAEILTRVPRSRLVLKYRGMTDSSIVNRCGSILAQHGIDQQRVTFADRSPHAELLGEYRRIDLALDPFPCGGGLTTCESLWMGVPVITCPGETFASRISLSVLSSVGFTETVARDLADYVELASGLADDVPRLAKWRTELRERMAQSPLCDGPRFAGQLMHNLRTLWREWCDSNPLSSA